MDTPPTLLIAGLPGAGKTSVARRLAESFDRSVHLEVDRLRAMMVRGQISPEDVDGWNDALAEQCVLESRAASALADCYRASGITVIVDDVALPPVFHRCYANEPAMHKVLLLPSADALAARLERRGDIYDQLFQIQAHMLHTMLVPLEKPGWTVLDTSDLSVEETVAAVLQSLP